jgi:hypothetical protein
MQWLPRWRQPKPPNPIRPEQSSVIATLPVPSRKGQCTRVRFDPQAECTAFARPAVG